MALFQTLLDLRAAGRAVDEEAHLVVVAVGQLHLRAEDALFRHHLLCRLAGRNLDLEAINVAGRLRRLARVVGQMEVVADGMFDQHQPLGVVAIDDGVGLRFAQLRRAVEDAFDDLDGR